MPPLFEGLRKRLASSKIAKELIACVLIASVFMLVMNRVIGSTHDTPSVVSNMRLKVSISAELGILKRSGGQAVDPFEEKAKASYNIFRARGFSSLSFSLGREAARDEQRRENNKMRVFTFEGLRKRLASSKLAKELIACVLIASVKMLVMNRVIGSTHDLSF